MRQIRCLLKFVLTRLFQRRALLSLLLTVSFTGAGGQGLSFGGMDARPAPEWLSKASIYELWLNVFSKEGNLRGAIPRLQQIADLGAAIVYLGPVAKRSAEPGASPYSIADYNEIDPECGTPQDCATSSPLRTSFI